MKKIKFFAWLLLAATTLMFSSCNKEEIQSHGHELTKVFEFNVTFYGAGQRVATAVYSGLVNESLGGAAVSVYLQGNDYRWAQLPMADEDGDSFYYSIDAPGNFYFTAFAPEGYTWNNNFTFRVKVVVVPHYVQN